MKEDLQEHPVAPVSVWLDNAEVCRETIEAAGGLPYAGEAEFERFHAYLLVDEPIIQLMPGYFLPLWAEREVRSEDLHALAVAAKLENARNRWLDAVVDDHRSPVSVVYSQELNRAIVSLTNRQYATVLPDHLAARFFEQLTLLYSRHSLSLVLDGKSKALLEERSLTLSDYEIHAKARHSSVRAPLDALLTLVGAGEDHRARATSSWHAWGLGAQLYDDALDVEEDFRNGALTWTVGRTLECLGGHVPENPDEFYAVALQEGIVTQTLRRAEAHFGRAAELALPDFPRWTSIQHGCMRQARTLREDYERLLEPEPLER